MKNDFYQFYYYVPKSHLAVTKKSVFAAGAGKIGKYSCCAWQTKGTGQFKPEPKSHAYIGKIGKICTVSEYKVESICSKSRIKAITKALKKSHPYENPAFGFIKLQLDS